MSTLKLNSIKYEYIIFLFLLISVNGFAQYSLSGKLTNGSNEKLDNMYVELSGVDSTFISRTVTDAEGAFTINKLQPGKYILTFSGMGYQNSQRAIPIFNENIDLGTVVIAQKIDELDEIQVVADQFVRRKDGMLIYPRKADLKTAGSGYDVLYNIMIPGVNVDRSNGSVTRLGEAVTLYIDGQKAEYREIQNLQVQEIDKIEYMDMPSGRYIQDNTAINIIMKKQTSGGYFAVDGKQNIGYLKGDYNFTAQYAKNNIDYSLFGGYGMGKYNNPGSSVDENFIFPDYMVNRKNNTVNDLMKENNQYIQLNIKSATSKRNIAGKISLIRKEVPENDNIRQTFYSNPENLSLNTISESNEDNLQPAINLFGGFQLPDNQRIDVYLTGSYSKNKYYRDYQEEDFYTNTNVNEDFYNANTSLNYTKQFRNRNVFSVYFLENYRLSESDYSGTQNYSQRLVTNEAILFAGYTHNFGPKWFLNSRIGSSWLNYKLDNHKEENQYFPRFNFALKYDMSQAQSLSLHTNIGNSFPTINSLNDIDQIVDPILIKRGNPNPDITKLYNIALSYNLSNKRFNLQTMLINNIYTNMPISDFYSEGDKMIHYSQSDENIYQYIGVLFGRWNFLENLSLKTEFAYIHSKFSGRLNDSHNSFVASADLNYSWKNFMLNVFVKAKQKQLTNSYILEEDFTRYGSNIRWSNIRWHVEVGVNNPFSKHNTIKKNFISPNYSSNINVYNKSYQQTAYLKLIYRFSFGKKFNVENTNINTNIESAIMKIQ